MAFVHQSRKSGFVLRQGGKRRETTWIGGTMVESTYASASAGSIITSLSAGALALRPFTVVRTRGLLAIRSDQFAVTEDYSAAYGECVVSDQASAAGFASVPNPDSDNDSEFWFVMEYLFGHQSVTTDIGRFLTMSQHAVIDSRAMRKVQEGEDLLQVGQATALSLGVILTSFARTLVKLH